MTLRLTHAPFAALRWSCVLLIPFALLCFRLMQLNTPPPTWHEQVVQSLSFDVDAFVTEMQRMDASWEWNEAGYWTNAYPGRWIHFENGRRITPGQPPQAKHTIYLFGSSVVYGFMVADDDTLSASLQRLTTWRVVNEGASPNTLLQQMARLKAIDLLPGDVIICYDDISDVFSYRGKAPDPWEGEYHAKLQRLRQMVESAGATFYAFIPAYAHEPSDCRVITLCSEADLTLLASTYGKLKREGEIDLSRLFVGQAGVFLDVVHITPAGNETVARAIYAALFGAF